MYQRTLNYTHLKLQDLDQQKRRQRGKVEEAFRSIREILEQREVSLKQMLNQKMAEASAPYKDDASLLEQILKDLSKMQDNGI
jgi:shikimate kinase